MALAHTHAANPHWLPPKQGQDIDAIPGENGWPIVGNTFRMLRDPAGFGRRMVARYGRVYRNRAFGSRNLALIGAEANELVLFDRDRIFSSEQGWGPLLNLLFPRGLMLMDFDHHRADRKILSVAFKPEPMRHYAEQLNAGIAARVAEWSGQRICFYDAVKQLSLDLAAVSFLGVELGEEAERINQAFVDEVQATVAPIRVPLPGTAMRKGVKAREYLAAWFRREIPRRRAGTNAVGGMDFFSQFCRVTDEEGRPLGDDAIVDHMNFLMMAAHDTITSSATSLVMLLGRHPEWQDKLREEIAAVGGDALDYGDLDKLVLTDYAFREALRMVPPVPSLPRRALKEFRFGGYTVPAGTHVGISPALTHHMEEYWPDPERFDPLRFTPEAVRTRHKYAWVPFGGGAHMCLGLHFAVMQVRILMFHILRGHRIALPEGSGADWQAWPIPRPKDGLPLTFERLP